MQILKNNKSSIILLISMLIGGMAGFVLKDKAMVLKPLANVFLNLLFVSIIPMIAVSIISSITTMTSSKTLGKILVIMFILFIITGIFASLYMLAFTRIFDPAKATQLVFKDVVDVGEANVDVLSMLTVDDFYKLLSKENLMALIVFSIIVGLALNSIRDSVKGLIKLTQETMLLINKIISYIMKLAPIGLSLIHISEPTRRPG